LIEKKKESRINYNKNRDTSWYVPKASEFRFPENLFDDAIQEIISLMKTSLWYKFQASLLTLIKNEEFKEDALNIQPKPFSNVKQIIPHPDLSYLSTSYSSDSEMDKHESSTCVETSQDSRSGQNQPCKSRMSFLLQPNQSNTRSVQFPFDYHRRKLKNDDSISYQRSKSNDNKKKKELPKEDWKNSRKSRKSTRIIPSNNDDDNTNDSKLSNIDDDEGLVIVNEP
jgi:hypothetical protein